MPPSLDSKHNPREPFSRELLYVLNIAENGRSLDSDGAMTINYHNYP